MELEQLPIAIDLSASVDITVPFHDADPAGVAWHGNYFRYFDDAGFPVGQGWEEVEFPGAGENVFALEVSGESMLPLYRPGDRLIVTRDADVRRGDRVVVRTTGGEVMAKILERKTGRTLELASFNPAHPTRTLPLAEVDWMARIIWASQ